MRIGEVARLAGVSARSIRHYHRLGVLDEPPRTAGGYREYDVADLVRIARISFLSSSGIPLREIGALLEGTPSTLADDIAAVRAGIDAQIADLTRQRDRLDLIVQRAADGLSLGLLPEPVSRALELCRADIADDPALSALIDQEHGLLDLVALNGDFPDALVVSYTAIAEDPARRRRYLDMLAGFHRIEGRRPDEVEQEITHLSDTLLADPALQALVAGPPPEDQPDSDENTGPTLEQLVPDPAQREVIRRALDGMGMQR